jgi:hypothetical protein
MIKYITSLHSMRELSYGRIVVRVAGLVLVSFSLLLVVGGTAVAGKPSSRRQTFPLIGRQPFAGFPLWKDAPGARHTALREGNFRGTLWGAYASRVGTSPHSEVSPCITLATITYFGLYSDAVNCGSISAQSDADTVPIYDVHGSTESGPRGRSISSLFFAMLLPTDVRKVEVGLEPGGPIVKRTQLLSPAQENEAKVAQFRFVVFAKRHDACVKRITGFTSSGAATFNARGDECPLRGER